MNTVISIENLSKSYQLGAINTGTFYGDLNRWWAKLHNLPDPHLKIGKKGRFSFGLTIKREALTLVRFRMRIQNLNAQQLRHDKKPGIRTSPSSHTGF